MFAMAWWTYHVRWAGAAFHEEIELGRMVYEVVRFYSLFKYRNFAIGPVIGDEELIVPNPFWPRRGPSQQDRILPCDPFFPPFFDFWAQN